MSIKNLINQNDMKTNKHILGINHLSSGTMAISNREALKDKIHEIHNYLRNNGAGYGMNALKIFNLFYGLKKIEEQGLLEKIGITDERFKFSKLKEIALEEGDIIKSINYILLNINTNASAFNLKKIIQYNVPSSLKNSFYIELVKRIDTISDIEKSFNVQLSGKIYEYLLEEIEVQSVN